MCTDSSSLVVLTVPGACVARRNILSLRGNISARKPDAAPDGVFLQAGLEGRSNALSLPLWGYHEGDFGEVRRRVHEVAGTAHDHLVLARRGHRQEGDLGLVVDVAQRLQLRIRERTRPPEEPRVDLVWRETVKLRLQRARVRSAGRSDQDRSAVLELDRTLLVHGICGLRGQVLLRPDVAQALGRHQQLLPAVRMRHVDQRQRPFSDRLSKQVCDAVFGNHVVHVRPRDSHPIAGFQQGLDPRGAVVGSGCQTDDRLAAG